MKRSGMIWKIGIACLMAALLFAGCGKAPTAQVAAMDDAATAVPEAEEAPMQTPETDAPINEPTGAADETVVSNVDAFLAAIGPNRTIYLNAGDYDLTAAKDYGQAAQSTYYEWAEEYDGFGLKIHDVENLHIVGRSANDVSMHTLPRYAAVLSFFDCENVSLLGVTAGHTDGVGTCAGAVIHLESTHGASVSQSVLYGCGTLGMEAFECSNVKVTDCSIRNCTLGAVNVIGSRCVEVANCRMVHCGTEDAPAIAMLSVERSDEVAAVNCTVEDNVSAWLLRNDFSQHVRMLGCTVTGNRFVVEAFYLAQYSPVIADCSFADNAFDAWYTERTDAGAPTMQAVNAAGETLTGDDLAEMQQADATYEAPVAPEPDQAAAAAAEQAASGEAREVHVSTVDEFLAAIASNTTIYLDAGVYDLSTASNYGAYGADHYYWAEEFDGPGLMISNVVNLSIVGADAQQVAIHAVPRYADVLTFEHCDSITISGVKLGHAEQPGECSGGVLTFMQTNTVTVDGCKLFGCGILGVDAMGCGNIAVTNTEIYDCSQGAVSLNDCDGVSFTNCNIHDCGEPLFDQSDCENVLVDGEPLHS